MDTYKFLCSISYFQEISADEMTFSNFMYEPSLPERYSVFVYSLFFHN